MLLRPQTERSENLKNALHPSGDVVLMPIALLNGPTADELMYASNLRQQWRGFSFGNFWFGYYFGTTHSSPQAEERWAVS